MLTTRVSFVFACIVCLSCDAPSKDTERNQQETNDGKDECSGESCDPCVPACQGKICGDDGCGGTCGTCPAMQLCQEDGKSCGAQMDIMVPMRDGVRLHTRVFLPPGESDPVPALLIRSPYVEHFSTVWSTFSPLTQREGLAFVYQTVRGVDRSEGELMPMRQEFSDGQDAVRWIAQQPWSNGSVGTFGSSYDGFTALAAAVGTPEVKLVLTDGAPMRAYESWPISQNGVTCPGLLWWDHDVKNGTDLQGDPNYLEKTTNFRPVRDLDLELFGEEDPIWRAALPYMSERSEYWDAWGLEDKLTQICTPVLHMQAKDEWSSDMLDTFLAMKAAPCDEETGAAQHFVLHSEGHGGGVYSPLGTTPSSVLIRNALAKYLLRTTPEASLPPVTYYVQNADEWRTANDWPGKNNTVTYYLDGSDTDSSGQIGMLSAAAPSNDASMTYTFDPALDDACTDIFTQQLAYYTEVGDQHLDLVGRPELVLYVKTDTPDTDLFAALYDESNYASLGMLRLRFRESMHEPKLMTPGEVYEIRLSLNAAAFRFAANGYIQVVLQSTLCSCSENPNTGGSMFEETTTRAATVEVLTGPTYPSRLMLPVVRE